MSERRKVYLHDGIGNPIGSYSGALDMHDADVHSVAFTEFFHEHTATSTTLSVAATAGDTSITVVSTTGFLVGDPIQIENGNVETTLPMITVIAGSVLTLDRPLDLSFEIGDTVLKVLENMNVSATLSSPRSFKIIPDGDEVWHVISLSVDLIHTSAGDNSLFGDIVALANGIILRGYNGTAGRYRTLSNWKSNGDFGLDFGGIAYTDKAGGGKHGTSANVSIKARAGAIPSISGPAGDYLEVLVQDNLAALFSVRVKAQGHVI